MSKEAMKLALEALMHEMKYVLCCINLNKVPFDGDDFHEALRLGEEALNHCEDNLDMVKQEQRSFSEHLGEPVAWESVLGAVARGWCYEENANKTMDSELAVAIAKEVHALYTTPQQRTWVGLTEQEQGAIMESLNAYGTNLYHFANAIEAKLKEKNT
jgi:hypothetical protein